MRDIPDHRKDEDDSTEANDAPPPSTALAVRAQSPPALSWSDRVATLLRHASELARDPAVAATVAASATVAGQIAFRGLRRALGSPPSSPAALNITAVIVHRIDIVHHYVTDAEGRRALPPS